MQSQEFIDQFAEWCANTNVITDVMNRGQLPCSGCSRQILEQRRDELHALMMMAPWATFAEQALAVYDLAVDLLARLNDRLRQHQGIRGMPADVLSLRQIQPKKCAIPF